jgi:FMN phosphatase YigB (HAD superfamily)
MKKVISFDLDGTLVNADYGNSVWLKGIPERYARRHALTIEEAKQTVKEQYNSIGEANLLWYDLPYWIERFDIEVSVNELLEQYESHIILEPYVAEMFTLLNKDYVLVIASNAARIFVEKELHHTEIFNHFDHVFSATTDFSMVKKQEDFYRRMCGVLGVAPSEVIHIGDHQVFDYEVPRKVGIKAFHYSPAGKAHEHAVSSFRELRNYL